MTSQTSSSATTHKIYLILWRRSEAFHWRQNRFVILQHIKNSREGGEIHQPPLYHGGGMTLRVRPRVNTLGCIKAQPFLENIYKSFQYNPLRYVEWQRNISRHFCLAAFQFWICMLMWLLFIRVLEMSYRVNFSPLYQSCPFVTSRLVFQNQRKDKRKHRSLVSSENECKRKRKKKNRKSIVFKLTKCMISYQNKQ